MLLEQFVAGFKVKEGRTFQVQIGKGRSVDFLINGVLVEYHAMRLVPERGKYGDFPCRREYFEYTRRLSKLGTNRYQRNRLYQSTCQRLAGNYYQRRNAMVQQSARFRGHELIVAATREEFYQKVMRRFAGPKIPSLRAFLGLFWWWVNIIARQNGLPTVKKSCYKRYA